MTKIAEIAEDNDKTSSVDYVKNFSKRMLKTHLFIGSFHEKRFVESLGSYRDVIRIDPEESQFIENLLIVKRKINKISLQTRPWIGITEPDTIGAPVGHNIWVELPIEIFGKYWFKVKSVEFTDKEIRLRLDVIRPLKHENRSSEDSELDQNSDFDLNTTVHELSNKVKTNLWHFYKEYVTLTNIKESVIFITVLITTILAGGVNIVKYLMEYLLIFMRETSGLLKVSTPIIISLINLAGRSIQGLYSMIVSLYHGKQQATPPVYNSYIQFDPNMMPAIQFTDPKLRYNKYFNQKAIPYRRSGSGVTLTSLDD